MPLNTKPTEKHKETHSVIRRSNSKPAVSVQIPEKVIVKRKSTNSMGPSDNSSKAGGMDTEKIATKVISRRATMDSLTAINTVAAANPRFAALGRKVKSLVRCKLAFQRKVKYNDEVTERTNTMEVIHKMPTEARFSSFLSPEAQYAMMKGYEDVLHTQLVESNPEVDTILVRNKTPINRIGIRKQTTGAGNLETTMEADDEHHHEEDKDKRERDDKNDQDDDSPDTRKTQSSLMTSAMMMSSMRVAPGKLQRCQSLQGIIPHNRRLVLTYRIESAMDILDTIRHKHGQVPLSPRVVEKSRDITPITDYNSWANVWCKEFDNKA